MSNLKFGIEKMIVGSFLLIGILYLFFGILNISFNHLCCFLGHLDQKYFAPLSLSFLAISYLSATYSDHISYKLFKRDKNRISYEDLIFFYENAGEELLKEITALRSQDVLFRIFTLAIFLNSVTFSFWTFIVNDKPLLSILIFLFLFTIGVLCFFVYRNNNNHYDTYREKAIEYIKKKAGPPEGAPSEKAP